MAVKTLKDLALDFLLQQIDEGVIKPGDRIPGQREIAAELNISYGPASQALMDLKRMGITVARGRAGTFLKCLPADVKVSETDNLEAEHKRLALEIIALQKKQAEIVYRLASISRES